MVVEAELVAEVADGARAAPPLDIDGIEVDQPARGERARPRASSVQPSRREIGPRQAERAAEEVRDDGDERVAQAVEDRLAAGLAVEQRPAGSARRGRRSRRRRARASRRLIGANGTPARAHGVPRDAGHGGSEQHLLPRLHGVERIPAHAGVVEERHHEVVEREPDDEDVERDDRPPPDGDDADREQGDVDDEDERRSRVLQPEEHLARVAVRRGVRLVPGSHLEPGGAQRCFELRIVQAHAAVRRPRGDIAAAAGQRQRDAADARAMRTARALVASRAAARTRALRAGARARTRARYAATSRRSGRCWRTR